MLYFFILSGFKIAAHCTLTDIYHIYSDYNSGSLFSLTFSSDASIFGFCQDL